MSGFVKLGGKKPIGSEITKDNNVKKWSDGIAQQSSKQSTPLNIQMVPLSQIKIDPKNARSFTITFEEIKKAPKLQPYQSPEEADFIKAVETYFSATPSPALKQKIEEYLTLAELAHSISEPSKLINPVTAYLDGMEFQLIAGHRRTFAHFILGADIIATNIVPKPATALEHFMTQWKENEDREDLTLLEKLMSLSQTIKAWENVNNETMSITKLMTLLNLKKTKAHWYLNTVRAYDNDPFFRKLISSKKLNSLEAAFSITNLKDNAERQKQINNLLLEETINFKKVSEKLSLSEQTTNPPPVRSPDSKLFLKKAGLKMNNETNRKFIGTVINILLSSPSLAGVNKKIEGLNLSSKKGLTEAWLVIYEAIGSNENE
jgi:hypothetical protein